MAKVETLQAKTQRVCEAFDKRFGADIWKPKLRDRKAGQPMAEPERQDQLDRLEEVTIVQAAILGRLERKSDEAIRRHDDAIKKHDEEIADLRGVLEKLVSSGQKTNATIDKLLAGSLNTKAAADSLIETVDRFLRGQEGNGRKQ